MRPVSENPQPALPVTVTDTQGTQVQITDADRILALDLYGSLSRIASDRDANRIRIAFLYVRGKSGVYYMFGQGTGASSLIIVLGSGFSLAVPLNTTPGNYTAKLTLTLLG